MTGISGESPPQPSMSIEAFLALAMDPAKWTAKFQEFKEAQDAAGEATIKADEYANRVRAAAKTDAAQTRRDVSDWAAKVGRQAQAQADALVANAQKHAADIVARAAADEEKLRESMKAREADLVARERALREREETAAVGAMAVDSARVRFERMSADAEAARQSAQAMEAAFRVKLEAIMKAAS